MPYKLVMVGKNKAKVKKAQPGRPKYFSKSPLSIETAKRQMKALYLSEKKK